MIYEYYILGKIPYKIERGGRGSSYLVRIQDSEFTETFDLIPKGPVIKYGCGQKWVVSKKIEKHRVSIEIFAAAAAFVLSL